MTTPSKAISGQGMTVEIGTSNAVSVDDAADTFVEIGEVTDADPPNPTRSTIDVTHVKSQIAEFIAGIIDAGQASFDTNFVASDPGQIECRTALESGELRNFRVTFNTDETPNRLQFKGLVLTAPAGKTGTNQKVGSSITVKCSSFYAWVNA